MASDPAEDPEGAPFSLSGLDDTDVSSAEVPRLPSTPRSELACRRQGIEPSELMPVDMEKLKQPGDSDFLGKQRFQHHERIRHKKLEDALEEYKLVLHEIANPAGAGAQKAALEAAKQKRLADVEARRQIKKKEKQRKEIENMIFQSKKAVETEEKIKQQEVADAERALREEALRKQKAAEMKKMADEKAAYRAQKALELERELELIAQRAEEKDKAQQKRDAALEERRQEEKRQREEEIKMKMLEFEREQAEKALEEEVKIRKRLEDMEEKERLRKEKMAAEHAARQEEAERKRAATEERIAQQQQKQAGLEEQRMQEAQKRQEDLARRNKLRQEQEALELKRRHKEAEEKAAEQAAVRKKMEDDAAARIHELMEQQKQAAIRQEQMALDKEREQYERREIIQMQAKEKMDYISRTKKMISYQRNLEQKKIADETEARKKEKEQAFIRNKLRADKMKDEKANMDHLREKMDQMRITKKFEIPEGFLPPPKEEQGSGPMPPIQERSPSKAGSVSHRSVRGMMMKKKPKMPRSAGPDMDAETVNVYSHWGDEMRRHQAQQTLKAKKARKKGPRHKASALFTKSAGPGQLERPDRAPQPPASEPRPSDRS